MSSAEGEQPSPPTLTDAQIIAVLLRCNLAPHVRGFVIILAGRADMLNAADVRALQHLAHVFRRQLGGCLARYCARCVRRGWRKL